MPDADTRYIIGVDHAPGHDRAMSVLCRVRGGVFEVIAAGFGMEIRRAPTHAQRIAARRRLRRAKKGWR